MYRQADRLESFSETVTLVPMLTAAAAVRAMLRSDRSKRAELQAQIGNADRLTDCSQDSGWQPVRPAAPMRTGILLLEAKQQSTRSARVDVLRERFVRAGVAVSASDGGLIRASLPDRPMDAGEIDHFRSAWCRCA